MDPAADLALRTSLALLLGSAALHKLRDLAAFRRILWQYHVLPETLVRPAPALLVTAELASALVLLMPAMRTLGAVLAASLLAAYSAAVGVNVARGIRHLECGCMGPYAHTPISPWLVARNLVVAVAALTLLLPVVERPLVWIDALTVTGAIATLVAGWMATDRVLALQPVVARMRGRA